MSSSAVAQSPPTPTDTVIPVAASLPALVVGKVAQAPVAAVIPVAVSLAPVVVPALQPLGESATPAASAPTSSSPPPLMQQEDTVYVRASMLFPLTPDEVEDDRAQGMLPHHSKTIYYQQSIYILHIVNDNNTVN